MTNSDRATEYARGQKLLRQLLPWAKAEARKDDMSLTAESALGKATAAYVTLDNLDALLITPAPLGGWHADIVFKHTPPGVPNTMGTPVATPCRTRQEAEDTGKRLLVAICVLAARNAASSPAAPEPVFLLHGYTFKLLPELFEAALALAPEGVGGPNGGYASKDRAIERIEETLADLCPKGFDGDAFNAWDRPKKAALLTVLHIAALTGVFAYPPRRDASPSGHQSTSHARH